MKNRTRWLGWVSALATITALLVPGSALALPPATPKVGMVCTPPTTSPATFNLVATTGTIQTPDSNQVFMWSYADGSGLFQYPGPVLCVTEGDSVSITLTNPAVGGLPEATSIVFPGQENVQTTLGDPGTPGLLTSEAMSGGGSVTYTFTASNPGTYLYESGTNISKQVEMGLYGALVIRPSLGANYAYNASTQFDPTREYMLLLSEVDPDLHHALDPACSSGCTYDFNALHNRYYFVNGRAFPDTLQSNGSALLPTQPYGALVRIQPTEGIGSTPQPALIRMLNAGVDNHPFHPHGNHTRQIAQDGRPILNGGDASTEHFGETIGSGQTLDYLIRWDNQVNSDNWNPVTNPLPVAQPSYLNLVFKDGNTWYSGSPYLGYKGTLPTGTNSLNVCGEWYFPLHSHALNEFVNFDEPFGGMATLLRVDPLSGCFTFPSSTKITVGTLKSGTFASLSANDSTYYKVNSTGGTTDWYGQFSGVPAGSSNLKATYIGNNVAPTYTQNFNTLAASGTSSTLPAGWALSETGTGANGTYAADNGSLTAANTYSYGTTAADRAFGNLRNGTSLVSTIGASFTNTTGGTINSLTVSYTGELWRYGAGSGVADRLDFQYCTGGGCSLTSAGYVDFNALDFNSLGSGAAGARDGNAPANRTALSSTVTGLSIAPGATYWLRWTDFNRTGTDDGLAVDDFSITPHSTAAPATTVYIWNWALNNWASPQLAGPTPVGETNVTVANNVAVTAAPVAGSWASYIGTGANKGLVRVRVLSTLASSSFVTGGDFMSLVYDAP